MSCHSSGHSSLPSPLASSESSASQASDIETSEYRVGAPAPLPQPSLRTTSDAGKASEQLINHFYNNFTERAGEVLEAHKVEWGLLDFRVVSRPGNHREPTLQIIADWSPEVTPAWKAVVKDLKEHIDKELLEAGTFGSPTIIVEIMDCQILEPKFVGPILNNPQLEIDWIPIRERVFSILQTFKATKDAMTTISIFRYGYSGDARRNPIVVFISLDGGNSDMADWPAVLSSIQRYLDTLPYGLAAHMERNDADLCVFDLLQPHAETPPLGGGERQEYRDPVNLGGEVGPGVYTFGGDGRKRNSGFGTLGCYIEVKTKSTPEWTRYGLTNYHVVRPCFDGFDLDMTMKEDGSELVKPGAPSPGSSCWDADSRGFTPKPPPHRRGVESPSRRTHNLNVYSLRTALGNVGPNEQGTDCAQRLREELDRKIAFFDGERHVFGTLWAGSGFRRRSPGNQRLDWALIRVNDKRQGSNMLPSLSDWDDKYGSWHWPLASARSVPLKGKGQSVRDLESGDLVFKFGATTGYTSGTYHRFQSKVSIQQDRHMQMPQSSEHVFMPHEVDTSKKAATFADHGDSGAVAFNASGEILGLLFTGQAPKDSDNRGYAFITPIEDVFADIQALSKGAITDIRVSPR